MRKALAQTAILAAGIAAGLVLSGLLAGRPPAIAAPAAVTRADPDAERAAEARSAAVTARLQEAVVRLRAAESAAPTPAEVPAEAPAPEAPETSAERVARLQDDFAHEHALENPDPRWSAPATVAFRSHLEGLREAAGFVLTDADCRMTTCLAHVRWPRCEAAGPGTARLRDARFPADGPAPLDGCRVGIIQAHPMPGREAEPCTGTVHLDCERARAGGVP